MKKNIANYSLKSMFTFQLFLYKLLISQSKFSGTRKSEISVVGNELQKWGMNFLLLAVARRLFCFGSLVILDVARCYFYGYSRYI